MRPTSERVRAAVFSIIGTGAVEGKRVLDLYAGTGAIGIDALSRGAAWVDFVERDARRCRAIRGSLRQLGLEQKARVHAGQARKTLPRLADGYDVVFADPPYESDELAGLGEELERAGLLNVGATVVLERPSNRAPINPSRGLRHVSDRKYGDTTITILKAGALDADSSLPGNV